MKFDYQKFEEELDILLAENMIESWVELTAGQYRINNFFDIYPKNRKYFNSITKRRDEYVSLDDLEVLQK